MVDNVTTQAVCCFSQAAVTITSYPAAFETLHCIFMGKLIADLVYIITDFNFFTDFYTLKTHPSKYLGAHQAQMAKLDLHSFAKS